MKKKFEIYREAGYDPNDHTVKETIKTFKNESDAIAFYNDPKNQRRYGSYSMSKHDTDGHEYSWNERTCTWQGIA